MAKDTLSADYIDDNYIAPALKEVTYYLNIWFTDTPINDSECQVSNCKVCEQGGYWSVGNYYIQFSDASRTKAILRALKRFPKSKLRIHPKAVLTCIGGILAPRLPKD